MRLNQVNITGNVTKDPELKYATNGGRAFCIVTVCFDTGYFSKDDNKWVSPPNFIDVCVMDKRAEQVVNEITKGKQVIASGILRIKDTKDNNGVTRRNVSIIGDVMLLGKPKESNNNDNPF